MENDSMIDERFKFPHFETTHWLAVQNILKDFIKGIDFFDYISNF